MVAINLQAHSEHQSGYGRMGVELRKQLALLGVESVGDIGLAPDLDDRLESQANLKREGGLELARVALWLSTPPHVRGWYEGQFATIFTMWESAEIPPAFRQNLHHFDRIIVPSLQNKELYDHFHADVRYVPLGIDPEAWGYQPRPPVDREFRFFCAGYGPRKGCKQVAAAFLKVFPGGRPPSPLAPIPRLILRSRDDIYGPGITMIPQNLGTKAEIDLYANAHCYVSGSKGEGWGLMPLQAIAQGMPTILGDAHGHHAFAHYGIPLDVHDYDATGATFWGDGGQWWEPDFDQMCEAMWEVYCNYDAYAAAAITNSFKVTEEFTWARSAEALVLELADHLYEAPPVAKVWKGAPPKLFHIRVNKECAYTINGVTHAFSPGHDYYESADLKRAIIASGHLDMSTFDPHDIGVEDSVDLSDLRARNSICPTCKQPYNRDDTLRELIGAVDGGQ
jgi:glycosyltransferase involved in cell wall biosynthesis